MFTLRNEFSRRYLAALSEVSHRLRDLSEQKEPPSSQQKKNPRVEMQPEEIRVNMLAYLIKANTRHMQMIYELSKQRKVGLTLDFIEKLIQENARNRSRVNTFMEHFNKNPCDSILMTQEHREFNVYVARTYLLEDNLLGELGVLAKDKRRWIARDYAESHLRGSNSSIAEVMRNDLSKRTQESDHPTKRVVAVSDLSQMKLLDALYQKLVQALLILKQVAPKKLSHLEYAINLRFAQYHLLQFLCSDQVNCTYESLESSVKLARDNFGITKAFEHIYDQPSQSHPCMVDLYKGIRDLADQLVSPKKENINHHGANHLQMRR
ncbi:MAG: hypothetical protein ABI597_10855 [Gammaproteobacteria bacterium]